MLPEKSEGCKILIALEGPDYSGKSELAKRLVDLTNEMYGHESAMSVSRPGGTIECLKFRELITNTKVQSITRQTLAFAEEILFAKTFSTKCPIVFMDRYNPISGQIYGPLEQHESWKMAVSHSLTYKPDLCLFIHSEVSDIVSRIKIRSNKQDVMDQEFINRLDEIIFKYEEMYFSSWAQNNCHPCLINNDSTFEKLVETAWIRSKATIDYIIETIGLI